MTLKKTKLDTSEEAVADYRPGNERVAADLRDQILSEDIEPGDKLPSTKDLAETLSISPTTVQNAVQMLKKEGLVQGARGKSVTVRGHRMRTMRPADYFAPAEPGEAYRWISEAERNGMRAASTLLDVDEVAPPPSVARALGLGKDEKAVLRAQLLTLNDEPAELVHCFYPADIARGTALAVKKRIRGGAPTLLDEMGFPFRRAVDQVSARIATPEQVELLQLPSADLPVLRTFRVVHSTDDRVIEVTVMAKAGHLFALEYETQSS